MPTSSPRITVVMTSVERKSGASSLNLIATEAAKLSIALIKGDAVKYKAEKAEGGANQILLDPIVITKENVDFLVKDGFYTKEQLGL